MEPITKDDIASLLHDCVSGAISRLEKNDTHKPFHEALLTKELLIASSFERSFSTSFGQGAIEEISLRLARDNDFTCARQKNLILNIPKSASDEITRILASLRAGGNTRPNWNYEVQRVLASTKGDYITVNLISDLWLKKNNCEYFISLKTVKPNIDQVEKAKRDMLHLLAHDNNYVPYLALYYNPGGPEKANYNWTVPTKIFDILRDPCILIGKEYWDFIGGPNTYEGLLRIFSDVGEKTRGLLHSLGH